MHIDVWPPIEQPISSYIPKEEPLSLLQHTSTIKSFPERYGASGAPIPTKNLCLMYGLDLWIILTSKQS